MPFVATAPGSRIAPKPQYPATRPFETSHPGARRREGFRTSAARCARSPAANALGIDIARYKLAAFVIAAVYASVAGSLFAHFVGFISPEVFGLSMVTLSFTMLYLGGIGTIWGPIVGAVIVSMLPELFRGLKELQDIAYASVLIAILIFFPRGLAALPGMLWGRRDETTENG